MPLQRSATACEANENGPHRGQARTSWVAGQDAVEVAVEMRLRAVWGALMTEVFASAVVEAGQVLAEPVGQVWVDSLGQVWRIVRAKALPGAATAARV